jgi:hypothetical protein
MYTQDHGLDTPSNNVVGFAPSTQLVMERKTAKIVVSTPEQAAGESCGVGFTQLGMSPSALLSAAQSEPATRIMQAEFIQ